VPLLGFRPVVVTVLLAALAAPVLSGSPAAAELALTDHPTSHVMSPAPGGRLSVGVPATISGLAVNGEAGGVVQVEISLDGGGTWSLTDYAQERWSYTFTPTEPGKLVIVTRASTVAATEVPNSAVAVVVEPDNTFDALACPCVLWFNSTDFTMAEDPDEQAVELGVRFRANTDGFVTGVRFARFPANSGAHIGRLWSADGQLLAEVTFTGETDEGWQEASFDQPVPVRANTAYIASYYTPTGHYASTESYFSDLDFYSSPLQTLEQPFRLGEPRAGAGVYHYGDGGGFPDQTWHDSNYWVSPVLVAAPTS